MKIGLHDDDTGFPNLALMKISAWHKRSGDSVELFCPINSYDKVYSSKVFTFTPRDPYLPSDTVCGGTGYLLYNELNEETEHICPDYSLYKNSFSMGFLTRGCIRSCPWCIVPKKEGKIHAHADIEEFARHREVVLLDNNVLAHEHGIRQIEKIASLNLKVDFNQGLDARLIDDSVAKLLAKLSWIRALRLACDSAEMLPIVTKAIQTLRWNNVHPQKYFCYCLVKDVAEAAERVRVLKGMYIDPFCQPFRDQDNTPATKEQRAFARWVNQKAEFNSRTWADYRKQYLKEESAN